MSVAGNINYKCSFIRVASFLHSVTVTQISSSGLLSSSRVLMKGWARRLEEAVEKLQDGASIEASCNSGSLKKKWTNKLHFLVLSLHFFDLGWQPLHSECRTFSCTHCGVLSEGRLARQRDTEKTHAAKTMQTSSRAQKMVFTLSAAAIFILECAVFIILCSWFSNVGQHALCHSKF